MFCQQDLVGVAGKAVDRAVFLNGRRACPVKLHRVRFTQEGMARLGQGIRDLSARYGLHESQLKEAMAGALYTVPPNPSLYFLFSIPGLEADVHVEIPRKFWSYTDLALERAMEEAGIARACACSLAKASGE